MNSSTESISIRTLRCRLGWCQSELAQRLRVTSSVVRSWESGEQSPSADQAQALEFLFRQTETAALELLQMPVAESLLDSKKLESVNLRDLVREQSGG
jgi:ribosome-binding protein aMBF1 (putative translation factor)